MKKLIALVAIGLFVLSTGCATHTERFRHVEKQLIAGQPAKALVEHRKIDFDARDQALQLLDEGMLLRLTGEFEKSNDAFETAKRIIEKNEATSVTETAGSVVVNDAVSTYTGESFERVLLHLYKAFNYLDLGERDSARVEVLQVDVRLQKIAENEDNKSASVYTEDAFARYLSGMIYEELREWSDALIAYRKAYDSYKKFQKTFGVPLPESLKYGLLRLAERQGLKDELEKYKKEFSLSQWEDVKSRKEKGEVVFFLNSGWAPIKGEKGIQINHMTSNGRFRMFRVALPYYKEKPLTVSSAKLTLQGEETITIKADLVEDINQIALNALEARMPAITARALARAVLKYEASSKISDNGGSAGAALGLLANVAGMLTERADTRSWLTLPHSIFMARAAVKPGTYKVTVELLNKFGGTVVKRSLPDVKVKRGKYVYLSENAFTKSVKK